jgi:coenzyme F420-reducing hydrogenase alpha subunit
MTAKEAAIDLIRYKVERGDDMASISRSLMGVAGGKYTASVGGYIFPIDCDTREKLLKCPKEAIKKVPSSKILVEEVGGKIVNEVFTLAEIYNIIKNKKSIQLSLI